MRAIETIKTKESPASQTENVNIISGIGIVEMTKDEDEEEAMRQNTDKAIPSRHRKSDRR